uniref:Large ribosomal subunit protein uL22c n=1 Tax=Biophytum sensitivum TaxID=1898900 RepID=A0A8E8PD10_9ROSI|nr:ribosomal protein L22 [Biophytum sensitivum]
MIFKPKRVPSVPKDRTIYTHTNKVYGRNICLSTYKAQRVIDQLRFRSYEETLMILELMPYRACYPVFKLVYSVAANAIHNTQLTKTGPSTIITKIESHKSSTFKKLKPRARGRSYPIKRSTSHIYVMLTDLELLEEYISNGYCFYIEDEPSTNTKPKLSFPFLKKK